MTIATTGVAALALLPLTHGIGSILPHDDYPPLTSYMTSYIRTKNHTDCHYSNDDIGTLRGASLEFSIRENAVKTAEIQCPKKDYRGKLRSPVSGCRAMLSHLTKSSTNVTEKYFPSTMPLLETPAATRSVDLKVDFSQQMRTLYSYAKQRGKTSFSAPMELTGIEIDAGDGKTIYADVEKSEEEIEDEAVTVVIPEMCSAVLTMIKAEYGSFEDLCYKLDLQAATAVLATKREKWLREDMWSYTIIRKPQ
ncbi:hypothetical protein FOZ60_009641 [Perkinsus olseni]|uniref:Uncharacterized protein n=1 Tax=Perkinsus olseni TaxID=32597 RepID=A0A7J6PCH6_PEROL|nr:hypothetical protein FOZ60_009641 [Perkinsus olseni]